jgi:hypothetical protein
MIFTFLVGNDTTYYGSSNPSLDTRADTRMPGDLSKLLMSLVGLSSTLRWWLIVVTGFRGNTGA